MICKKKLIETEGWNSCLVRASLIYWVGSPIEIVGVKKEKIHVPGGGDYCCYCLGGRPCMAKDKAPCKGKMMCHFESGVHFCTYHGQLYTQRWHGMMGTPIELDDERGAVFSLSRAELCDDEDMDVEPTQLLPLPPPSAFREEEDVQRWDPPVTTPLLPSGEEEDDVCLMLRDREIECRLAERPNTFWPQVALLEEDDDGGEGN
jgi:hypothetical protein